MSRLILTQSGCILPVGLLEMDMECENEVKNMKSEQIVKDVKEKMEDCGGRSETTEKNSKATDESYPMKKGANHKPFIRTTSKMEEISKSKTQQKEAACD